MAASMGLAHMQQQAEDKRHAARRARRLAAALSAPADQQRLIEYADELDQEADVLDRLAAAEKETFRSPSQEFSQVQQQQQQQHQSPSAGDRGGAKSKS